MTDKGLSDHGFPLVMACDHVLHQKLKPIQCDYSPPDYICENCHSKMEDAKTNREETEAITFIHLYCSDCLKKLMLDKRIL